MASKRARVGENSIPFPAKEKRGFSKRLEYAEPKDPGAGKATPREARNSSPCPWRNSSAKQAGGTCGKPPDRDRNGMEYLLTRKYQFGCPAHSTSQGWERSKGNLMFRDISSSAISRL